MRRAALIVFLALLAPANLRAGNFIPQASFGLPGSTVIGMDRDAEGNLYVLALIPGSTTSYTVSSYQTPTMAPEFTFNVDITTPLAFAVESNGVVDILDQGNALTLTRFNNVGAVLSQAARMNPYGSSYFGGAIDKANSIVYASYKYTVIRPTGDFSFLPLYNKGAINQYSFSGSLQNVFYMPGRSDISTTCYTPSLLSVDDQGSIWVADQSCEQIVGFNSHGTQTSNFPLPFLNFYPRGIWNGPQETVFVSGSTCDSNGCPHGELLQYNSGGAIQNSLQTSSLVGEPWDSRILYLAPPPGTTLQRYTLDNAPPPPVPSSPQGFVVQHSSVATMSWQAASDADGDPLLYSVYIGANPSQLAFAGSTSQTSFVSAPLTFGTTYFWQVTAQDSYLGLPMLTSTSAVVNAGLTFINHPPGGFAAAAGMGMTVTRNTSATFAWTASVDPDGDPVTYNVSWQPAGQSSATVVATTANSLLVSGLSFGTSVYWSVSACDPYSACTSMAGGTQVYLPVFENLPPSAVVYASTAASYSIHNAAPSVDLSWQTSVDPDGDPVSYQLDVKTSTGAWPSLALGSATDFPLSVQFETTYYWRVEAADSYGGVSTGAWNNFIVHLANRPPYPINYSSPNSLVTRATSYSLAWQDTGDPDGDAVTYSAYLSTSPSNQSLVQQGTQTNYPLNFQFGTTYYWRVLATDSFGAATTGALQTFLPTFKNSPPPPPGILAGTGVIGQHTLSPASPLAWSSVTDPDGDPVAYRLFVGTNSSSMALVQDSASTSYDLSGLQFGTTYYWQVAAYDPYGGASTTTLQSLCFYLQDAPPQAFPILTGTGPLSTRNTSAILSWGNALDPDGDSVSYNLAISTNPTALQLVQSSALTNFTLAFQFGTTYYWQVTALDGFGGATPSGVQSFLPVFQNSPPSLPAIASGAGQFGQHTLSPQATLAWSSALDPDGDPVAYRLFLSTNPAALNKVQDGAGTSFPLTNPLFGTTYYWQVAAYDPYGGASTTTVQSLLLSLKNSPPSSFQILSGAGTLSTRNTLQVLSWAAATDPDSDAVTYELELSTNPATLAAAQTSNATSFNLNVQFGTTYYWQVTARDGFGGATPSGLQTFLPTFRNSPPTVPVNQSKTGTIPYHGLSPAESFLWQASTDPDGDPFAYSLFYGTDSSHMSVASPVPLGFTLSNIPLDTGFFYSVVATDIYGAASASPINWVYYQFTNNPPGPFDVTSATGTIFTRQTGASLSWTPAIDPDGDSVSYGVFVGTAPAAMTLLTNTTKTSAALSNMADGATYYWTVSAYDGYGGTTTVTEGIQSLRYLFYDPPPTPVVYLSTAASYSEHTSSPGVVLNWAASANAAGDPISYRLDMQTDAGALTSTQMGAATSISLATVFETTYTWRVTAFDPYGGASTGAWLSFIVHLANRPPNPIVYSAPNTLVTRATSVALGWQDSGDPDGDPTSYSLFLSTNPSAQYLVQQGTSTAYNLNFQFGTTYYWSISATDSFGATTSGALQTFLPIFRNPPPPTASILSGSGQFGEHTLSPQATLAWSSVVDSDGDPTAYRLLLSTNPAALNKVQDGAGTSYPLPSPLFGTTYYWQVASYNPYGGTSTTTVQSLLLFLQNSPPSSFSITTGSGTIATRSTSLPLSWQNAVDPDGDVVTYELDLSTNPAALAIVQTSTATSFNLSIQFGTTYYWQVTARDGFGGATPSGLQTFLPTFRNSPPTVPVNQSKTGTIPYHGFSPSQSFFWQPSTDPDGDPFSYSLNYGADTGHMVAVSSAPLGYTLSNLPLNQAIFYQIVATDIYGAASSSPISWVYYQFANNPPGPFDVIGTTGTISTRQTSASLSWTSSTDPDGDPVSYGVLVGTAPSALALLTNTTKTSAVLSNMAFGTTYYWRVDAYDGFGGTTTATAGLQSLLNLFYDPSPSPIVYLSTAASYNEHTSSPIVALNWAASANAAGDPISYRLDIQTSTGTWSSISMGPATSLTLATVFETTYTWRVAAFDPYGGASTGSWMSFIPHLANRPPNPIVYSSSNSIITRNPKYALSWLDTGDPDGDPYSYSLFLSTSPAKQWLVQQGTATAYNLAFQFGTTYYWSVSATDSFGAVTTGAPQTFLPIFENTPPPTPAILQSTGTLLEHALRAQVPLSWSTVSDPDGDPTAYFLHIGTAATSLAQVQSSTQTAFLIANATFGATYYWQVGAQNPYGGASTTAIQAVTPVFLNNPPGAFAMTLGTGTLTTRTTTQMLAWTAAVDPDGDPVSYALSLSTNPAQMAVVQTSSATAFTLAFTFGTTYYWTVAAYDGFGGTTTIAGGTQTFHPLFLNTPPQIPNLVSPFSASPVVKTMNNSVTITWGQVSDPEGDPITYTIYLGNSPGNLNTLGTIGQSTQSGTTALALRPAASRPQSQVSIDSGTITLSLTNLDYYQNYYFQVAAANPYGSTAMTPLANFELAARDGFPKAYNYPNPFNPLRGGTNIVFNAPASGYAQATVEVYSEWQALLFKQDYFNIPPGVSQVPFAGRDRYGRALFNGSYVCRVRFSGPSDQTIFYMLVVK